MERHETDKMLDNAERTMNAIDKIVEHYQGIGEEIPQGTRNNIESFYRQLEINQFYFGKLAIARDLKLENDATDPDKNYWKYISKPYQGEHSVTNEYIDNFTIARIYDADYRDHMRSVWTSEDDNCETEEDVMEHRDEKKMNIREISHAGVYLKGAKSFIKKEKRIADKYKKEWTKYQKDLSNPKIADEDQKNIEQRYAEEVSKLKLSYFFDKEGLYEVFSNRTGQYEGNGANYQINEAEMYKTYDINPEKLAYILTRPSGASGPGGNNIRSLGTRSEVLSAENLQGWVKQCTEDTYKMGENTYWDISKGALGTTSSNLRSGIVEKTPFQSVGNIPTTLELSADVTFYYSGEDIHGNVTRKGHRIAYLERNKERTQERWKQQYASYGKLSDMNGEVSDPDDNAEKEKWLWDEKIHTYRDRTTGEIHHNNRAYMLPLQNEWVHNPDGTTPSGVVPEAWRNLKGLPANSASRNATNLGKDHHADDNPPVVTGFKINHPGMRSDDSRWAQRIIDGEETVTFNAGGFGVLGIPDGHPDKGRYFATREIGDEITPIPILDASGNQIMERWVDENLIPHMVPQWKTSFSDEQEAYIEHLRGNNYWDVHSDDGGGGPGNVDAMLAQIEAWRWSEQSRPAWKASGWDDGGWDGVDVNGYKIWVDENQGDLNHYDHEEYAKKFAEFPHYEELALKIAVMDIVDDEIEFLEGLNDFQHTQFSYENWKAWGVEKEDGTGGFLDGQYIPLCHESQAHSDTDLFKDPSNSERGYLLDLEENDSDNPSTGALRVINVDGTFFIKKDMDEMGTYSKEDYEQFMIEWYRYRDGFDYAAERTYHREIGRNRVRNILGKSTGTGSEMAKNQDERRESMIHLALPMFQTLTKKAQMNGGLLSAGEQGALEELNLHFKNMLKSNSGKHGYEMHGTIAEIQATLNRVEELSGKKTMNEIRKEPSLLKKVAENMAGFFNRHGFTIVADLCTFIGLGTTAVDDLMIPDDTYIKDGAYDSGGNLIVADPFLYQYGVESDGDRIDVMENWTAASAGHGELPGWGR